MKKCLHVLLIAFMALSFVVPASAYFVKDSLIQTVWETTAGGKQANYDLGSALNYLAPGYSVTINENVKIGDFLTTSWADCNLAIYDGWQQRVTGMPTINYGFALSTDINGLDIKAPSMSSFQSASNNVRNKLAAAGTQKVVLAKTETNGYVNQMQNQGNGGYAGWNRSYALGEVNLEPLDHGQTVTAYLFEGSAPLGTNISSVSLLGTFVIGLDGSGNLYKTFTAVPIPSAVWLVGSGLISLVSIRRRSA